MRNLKILEGGHPYIFVKILAKFKDKFWKVGLGDALPICSSASDWLRPTCKLQQVLDKWEMAVETRNNREVSKEVVAEG